MMKLSRYVDNDVRIKIMSLIYDVNVFNV